MVVGVNEFHFCFLLMAFDFSCGNDDSAEHRKRKDRSAYYPPGERGVGGIRVG